MPVTSLWDGDKMYRHLKINMWKPTTEGLVEIRCSGSFCYILFQGVENTTLQIIENGIYQVCHILLEFFHQQCLLYTTYT